MEGREIISQLIKSNYERRGQGTNMCIKHRGAFPCCLKAMGKEITHEQKTA